MQPNREPVEQAAVVTTIVGGRPPGAGQPIGRIPRGIEVLVKKAAVDAEFRTLLLQKRAEAAAEIALSLDPAEAMMLAAVPADQLEAIIARTVVPEQHRRTFLGRAAAAMLATLGVVSLAGCPSKGINPGTYPAPKGMAPDRPGSKDAAPDRPAESQSKDEPKPPAPEGRDDVLPVPKGKDASPSPTRGIQPDRPEKK